MEKDLLNTKIYLLNSIVCNYFDAGITPNVDDVQNNWQYGYYKLSFNDTFINDLISKVQRYYI